MSVIVRTVDGGERLAEALDSLAAQTLRDFETVVVDMSGGAAAPVLDRFASALPSLVRLSSPRRSRPAALNAGIRAASAPMIALLDDDNRYDPPHLERLSAAIESSGADYVYTGVRHLTLTASGALISGRESFTPFDFESLVLSNYIYATGSLFRRALWERLGGYDERFTVFEDWDFLLRVAQSAQIVALPGVSGESRKFTGDEAHSNFERAAALGRSHAGIYWKHRRLYQGRRFRALLGAWAFHCERRRAARRAARFVVVPLEVAGDLASWWIHSARHRQSAS